MMMRLLLYSICLGLLLVTGCKPVQKTTTSGSQSGKYHEDLSGLRPKAETLAPDTASKEPEIKRDVKAYVEPRYTVNKQIDVVLDSIDRINLTRKFIDGFTIQVYAGLKREEALAVKKDLSIYMPKLESDVQYNQPNFRVKAGKYFSQLEAQKDFQQVKQYFPTAIVVPDRIPIN